MVVALSFSGFSGSDGSPAGTDASPRSPCVGVRRLSGIFPRREFVPELYSAPAALGSPLKRAQDRCPPSARSGASTVTRVSSARGDCPLEVVILVLVLVDWRR